MVNAMSFNEDYADPNSGIIQYGKVLGLLEAPVDEIPADSIYEYLFTLPADETIENGQVFTYQTPKTDVVNWVINRATGKSFQDNFYDKLWTRLGTDGAAYVLLDRNATLFAGGGLNATPNDLARFAVMILNGGRSNGVQVVPEAVIDTLSAGADTDAFSRGPSAKGVRGDGTWSYRAQWCGCAARRAKRRSPQSVSTASSSISTRPAMWRSSNNPLCRFRHRMWIWNSTSMPLTRSSDI